jgi:hypothetical protein
MHCPGWLGDAPRGGIASSDGQGGVASLKWRSYASDPREQSTGVTAPALTCKIGFRESPIQAPRCTMWLVVT